MTRKEDSRKDKQGEFRSEMPSTMARPASTPERQGERPTERSTGRPPETAPIRGQERPLDRMADRPADRTRKLLPTLVAAFNRGDLDAIGRHLDPAAVWHVPGRSPLAGDHKGKDAVLKFLRRVGEESKGTVKPVLVTALADDDYGFMWLKTTGERQGRRLDMNEAIVMKMRGDQITEVWHRPDPERFDAFFA